jgi:hypothetical protein
MDKKEKRTQTVSRKLSGGELIELVLCDGGARTLLAVQTKDGVRYVPEITLDSGEVLVPLPASHSLIKHRVVLLPSQAEAYGSTSELLLHIKSYITRYVSLQDIFLDIAATYVLLTWVFDRFNEVPYLRWKGDFGSGKTRALAVVGSICYKPIFASGASTTSPIFHTLDLFRGTLVFDEADFRFSDERADIIKIFNNGTVRGFPVLRAHFNDKKEFDPRAFDVYGPKLVAMRDIFHDYALESRFLTEEMKGEARPHIPISLPDSQATEALTLRNMLLTYRFRNFHEVSVIPAYADSHLTHRTNQILVPLLSLTASEEVRLNITAFASSQATELAVDRSTHVEALVLETIALIATKRGGGTLVPLSEIRVAVIRAHTGEFDRPLTSRMLGSIIRHRLGLSSYKSGVYLVKLPADDALRALCKRFGVTPGEADETKDDPSLHAEQSQARADPLR